MDKNQPVITTIMCSGCGNIVPKKSALEMYDFVCCSRACLDPLRIQRQNEDKKKEDLRKNKCSSFSLSGGGSAAH